MHDTQYYAQERERMVREQITARGIRDERVLAAMRRVPRHQFVLPEYRDRAYADCPLPIGVGQTISQPYIVGLMSEMVGLGGEETVLEIGTGSGYQAAILGYLARQVHTIERHAPLARRAHSLLAEMGLTNVHVHTGDGSKGLSEYAPYEAIVVTAAAPQVPKPLLEQLADGGRLALPVGRMEGQILELWRRQAERYEREEVLPVAFVLLRGEYGWQNETWS